MPEFTAQCPTCGFSFSTDESAVGITTTCASCSRDFVVELGNEPLPQNRLSSIRPDQILVTSGDLHVPYEVVGMVCFSVGTRGEMRSTFETLKTGMTYKLGKSKGQVSQAKGVGQFIGGVGFDSAGDISLAGQYAGASFNSSDLEIAFHVAVNQLQLRASYLNANAVIAFRYDIDFDSNANVLNFMATAFGTAVRLPS
jgi:uncharacterized protein YbjQ (UPF0145 family)